MCAQGCGDASTLSVCVNNYKKAVRRSSQNALGQNRNDSNGPTSLFSFQNSALLQQEPLILTVGNTSQKDKAQFISADTTIESHSQK